MDVKDKCFRFNLNLFFPEWVKTPEKEIMFLEFKEIKSSAVSSVQLFDQFLPVIFILRWEYLSKHCKGTTNSSLTVNFQEVEISLFGCLSGGRA